MKLVHSFHISKFERRIPMGSTATKPSCVPKEFWTGLDRENFPRGSKLFQKFRDCMREKEHSGEHIATKIVRLSRLVLSRNAHFMSHLQCFITFFCAFSYARLFLSQIDSLSIIRYQKL